MKKQEIINALKTIKTYLGMEVKLAQMKLADGVTVIEFDSLEVGKEVFIVNENGNVPMPISDEKGYELEDGNFLFVYEEGIIGEIKAPEAQEEEAPMEEKEPVAEVPVEASVEPQREVKKVVKSTIEEQHFAKIEELKKQIVELKAMIEVKEEVKEEVIELEETPKPISFNPEKTNESEQIKLAVNSKMSSRDKILNIIYNNK